MDHDEDDNGGCEVTSSFLESSLESSSLGSMSPTSPESPSSPVTIPDTQTSSFPSPNEKPSTLSNLEDQTSQTFSSSSPPEEVQSTSSSLTAPDTVCERALHPEGQVYNSFVEDDSDLASGLYNTCPTLRIVEGDNTLKISFDGKSEEQQNMDQDEGIEDTKTYEELGRLPNQPSSLSIDQQQMVVSNSNNVMLSASNTYDEEDHSTASNDDVSSGFGSGGGFDNYSYGSIGGTGGIDISSLMMDPNSALMLEEDDFGDNGEEDEDLDSPVERLIRRAGCLNSKARENACISIPSTLHQVMETPDDVDALMRLVNKLADDPNQSVRIELMEQIPQLTVLCHEYPAYLGRVMDHNLLPLIIRHVNNPLCQVRKTTQAALLVVLEQRLLAPNQVTVLCRAVGALTEAAGDRSEDDRADGLALMSRMAPILGRELMLEHFLERFTALCADSLWQIRKICAANFGEFTAITGTQTTEDMLLRLFVSLCKDNVWEVRKSCCESFMEVSSSCLLVTRHKSLSPIFVDLLSDQSRWVRVSAFQNLGMFISTFAAPDALDRRSPTTLDGTYDHIDTCADRSSDVADYNDANNTSSSDLLLSLTVAVPSSVTADDMVDGAATTVREAVDSSFNSFNFWRAPLPEVQLPCYDDMTDDQMFMDQVSTGGDYISTRDSANDMQHDAMDDDSLAQAAVASLASSEGVSSPTRRQRQDDTHQDSVLQRASEPVPFSEVVGEADCTRDSDGELNTSGDSTDSEDTIIELSTLSQGLLSIYDDDNTSDAFREGLRDRLERQNASDEARDLWLSVLDSNHVGGPSMDPATAKEIAAKVQLQIVVPQNLLEQFLLMVDPRRSETEEKDITRHCAFAIPAVALTLGREHWHVLRDTYLQLAQNYQWRVRRTLAYSMHQMASILGGEHASADLLPLYREFTVNEPECVRIGVLENLAEFVRVLPPEQRKAMLPTMKYFFGINDRRHRQEFGRQLVQLLKLYPPADCEEHLKLYCLILLTDNVVYNRQKCHGLISLLIEQLGSEGDTEYVTGVCVTLCKKFAKDNTWCRRQTFVFVAGRIFADNVMNIRLYCEHLLPQLLALADDRVPNVRLAVAEVITNHIIKHEYFKDSNDPETIVVHDVYSSLQRDRDRDVRYFANSQLTTEEIEALHGEKAAPPGYAGRQMLMSSTFPFMSNFHSTDHSYEQLQEQHLDNFSPFPPLVAPSYSCLTNQSLDNSSSDSHNSPLVQVPIEPICISQDEFNSLPDTPDESNPTDLADTRYDESRASSDDDYRHLQD